MLCNVTCILGVPKNVVETGKFKTSSDWKIKKKYPFLLCSIFTIPCQSFEYTISIAYSIRTIFEIFCGAHGFYYVFLVPSQILQKKVFQIVYIKQIVQVIKYGTD